MKPQICVIIGAPYELNRALAVALAEQGHSTVIMVSYGFNRSNDVYKLTDEVVQAGHKMGQCVMSIPVRCDLTNADAVKSVLDTLMVPANRTDVFVIDLIGAVGDDWPNRRSNIQ